MVAQADAIVPGEMILISIKRRVKAVGESIQVASYELRCVLSTVSNAGALAPSPVEVD